MLKRVLTAVFLTVFSLLIFSALNLYAAEPEWVKGEWERLYSGIEFSTAVRSGEKPIAAYILKIDTKKKRLSFFSTPPADPYEVNKSETIRQTAVEFLTENRLTVAVNGNFYNPFNATTQRTPGESNLCGGAVSGGVVVSPAEENFPVFTVTTDNRCAIKKTAADESFDGIETAVGGNQIVLQGGEIIETGNNDVHPRTAVGISEDGRFVYLMVIDGRQKDYSVGATYAETAELLRSFGAFDGLNLDGGGSTTMVVAQKKQGKKVDGENYRVINNPVGQSNQPGTLRYNGNHIGVRVK